MATLTIELRGEVAERLRERAEAEGAASVEALLADLAEREADVGGERSGRLHGLIREGYDSPSRPLPGGYFAGRKATLAARVDQRLAAPVG